MDLKQAYFTRRQALVLLGAAVILPSKRSMSKGETSMTTEEDVRVLSQLEGTIYRTVRDAQLGRIGDYGDLVARFGSDPDWRVSMTVAILQSWVKQRPLYSTVLAEIDRIDPVARGRRITGITGVWEEFEMRAHVEFGAPILPLAWEGTVKFGNSAPAWRTATFLAMMAGVPSEASIEPAAYVIETTNEQMLRERAALTLSKLPRDAVDRRLKRLTTRGAGIVDAVRTARELMG